MCHVYLTFYFNLISYLNFGAIGFVIGHEITHGFDDRGRQFDKDGNNKNWWDHETDQNFRDRAQCMVDQYNNYTVPDNGLSVNGVNTQVRRRTKKKNEQKFTDEVT